MKPARWVLDGPVLEDAGDVGGDIQVGPAIEARFRSDDCPEARFSITAYATAKSYIDLNEDAPHCPHPSVILEHLGNNVARFAPMPPEHLACSYKPGTVDVQEQVEYRMNGRMVNGFYESDDTDPVFYEWVGQRLDYPGETLTEQIANATKDARRHVSDWVDQVNTYMHWDGRTVPKS